MTYVITDACIDVKDRTCVETCPVDCIYEGERMLYIHPTDCIDCAACEPVCPVNAIYYEGDLPADLAAYAEHNAAATKGVAESGQPVGDPAAIAARARTGVEVHDSCVGRTEEDTMSRHVDPPDRRPRR